jgi:hypothetical protein
MGSAFCPKVKFEFVERSQRERPLSPLVGEMSAEPTEGGTPTAIADGVLTPRTP